MASAPAQAASKRLSNGHALSRDEILSRVSTPDQTASNVVIFEMMNFYKRRSETLEKENEALKKKMKLDYQEHRNEMADVQQRLHDQVIINYHFAHVNEKNAELIYRKHQAGIRLAHCFEELASAIELVEETNIDEDKTMALRYIGMKKNEICQRADIAVEMLTRRDDDLDDVTRFENEHDRTIIDLTSDTEEDSGEETEQE